jgi:hypothetical protein
MRFPTAFAAVGLILVSASATACSGGSKTAATAPPASAGASGTATTPGASTIPDSSSAKSFDVCTALTAAAASKITGTKFTKAKTSSIEGQIFNCEYDGPDAALLQISVQVANGKDALDSIVAALKAVGHPPNSVSGVGDEAFSEPNPEGNVGSVAASSVASYGALYGATFIQIGGLTYVTAGQGKQIVEELHSKL